jgi:hypothetical protein
MNPTYKLIATWKGGRREEVDEFNDIDAAKIMAMEYRLAYGAACISLEVKEVKGEEFHDQG